MANRILITGLIALLSSPAAAATVSFDDGTSSISWGADRSVTGAGGYRVTAEGRDALQPDGRTLVAAFGFFNDTILGRGHSRTFSGSVIDGDVSFRLTLDVDTTWNKGGPVDDLWSLSVDLPDGYSLTYDRWSVPEGQWGRAWITRAADPVPPPPAPVPLPAAGLLLAGGLAALWMRGRR